MTSPLSNSDTTPQINNSISPSELNEQVRVEWTKTRAHLERWKEERLLVAEEMRRVLAWFEWKAKWWKGNANLRPLANAPQRTALSAYTHKQEAIYRDLTVKFAGMWLRPLKACGLPPSWEHQYGHQPSLHLLPSPEDSEDEVVAHT